MRFPLMWRSTHDSYEALAQAQADVAEGRQRELERERDYWRTRTEKLLDHALFKANAVTAPVFQPPPEKRADPMLHVLSALSRTEIETKPPATPVTPMT